MTWDPNMQEADPRGFLSPRGGWKNVERFLVVSPGGGAPGGESIVFFLPGGPRGPGWENLLA
ncbi:MAG: hypothetical protein DRN55_06495, partial [Thermoplasmata archaeon]